MRNRRTRHAYAEDNQRRVRSVWVEDSLLRHYAMRYHLLIAMSLQSRGMIVNYILTLLILLHDSLSAQIPEHNIPDRRVHPSSRREQVKIFSNLYNGRQRHDTRTKASMEPA